MKMIIAVIQPTRLEAVREALVHIGVTRMTVADSQGYARQRGRTSMYRGHEYKANLLQKITLEILVNDDFLERTLETVCQVARTGPEGVIGDGKLLVMPVGEVIDMSNGDRGPGAVN